MPITYLPDEDHAVRYVPWARLRKTEDDVVIGVIGAAFKLRAGEDYLSATWLEYFKQATRQENIKSAVKAIRKSNIDVRPKSGFAIGDECGGHGTGLAVASGPTGKAALSCGLN